MSGGGSTGGAEFQRKFLMMLPALMQKEHLKELPCSSCGKMICVERAIVRDEQILCEECYAETYKAKRVPQSKPRQRNK